MKKSMLGLMLVLCAPNLHAWSFDGMVQKMKDKVPTWVTNNKDAWNAVLGAGLLLFAARFGMMSDGQEQDAQKDGSVSDTPEPAQNSKQPVVSTRAVDTQTKKADQTTAVSNQNEPDEDRLERPMSEREKQWQAFMAYQMIKRGAWDDLQKRARQVQQGVKESSIVLVIDDAGMSFVEVDGVAQNVRTDTSIVQNLFDTHGSLELQFEGYETEGIRGRVAKDGQHISFHFYNNKSENNDGPERQHSVRFNKNSIDYAYVYEGSFLKHLTDAFNSYWKFLKQA